jgi:hypothetical protein
MPPGLPIDLGDLRQQSVSFGFDPAIFQWSVTNGVQQDILCSSHDKRHCHIYGGASQYNYTESTGSGSAPPGKAMSTSEETNSQGTLIQRTNPRMFELINAASWLGMNGLANVLGEENTALQCLRGGVLQVQAPEEMLPILTDYQKKFRGLEQLCTTSVPNGGENPVHLILASAPSFAVINRHLTSRESESEEFRRCWTQEHAGIRANLETFVAYINYSTQLQYALEAKTSKAPVVLHLTAHGTGSWANDPHNVALGFKMAASQFQHQLREKGNIQVQFEVFNRDFGLRGVLEGLRLPQEKRIGDPE